MISTVLFDMDGVVSNTEPAHEKADAKILGEYGVRLDSRWKQIKGMRELDVYRKAIEMYNIKGATPEEILAKKIAVFGMFSEDIKLFSGLHAALGNIKGKYRLALVSSSPKEIVELVVNRFELRKYFEQIITGDDVVKGKPDPEPYLKAAKEMGVSPEECVVVEDSINGVKSAKAAGMKCIAITSSFPREELVGAGADAVINVIIELPVVLELISKK
ncbi:MAG: HAD family phosphatase [Candidatus Micrarchaeota archaeon]|nr:HAD family phosphatase [Candidatus Micrarchaeota archaeon]